MEFFVEPGTDEEWHQTWIDLRTEWYVDLGIDPDNLRHFEHPEEKLSHYSKRTVDIEYRFGFAGSEWGELEGIANRTDFDLKQHTRVLRPGPVVLRPGIRRALDAVRDRARGRSDASLMAFLIDAYAEDEAPNAKGGVDKRTVLRLDPRLAPVKVAVLPLSRNADLSPKAQGARGRAAAALERRLRRRRRDRPALPPPGRDRYAVLRHRRLRQPRRPRGDGARARLDGAGADQPRQAARLLRRATDRLLSRCVRTMRLPRLSALLVAVGLSRCRLRWRGRRLGRRHRRDVGRDDDRRRADRARRRPRPRPAGHRRVRAERPSPTRPRRSRSR